PRAPAGLPRPPAGGRGPLAFPSGCTCSGSRGSRARPSPRASRFAASFTRPCSAAFDAPGSRHTRVRSDRRNEPLQLPVTETVHEVVVDHADRLHVGVDDRRADEAEAPALQVLAERVGFRGGRRNLPRLLPTVHPGAPADELPAVGVETAELLLDREKPPRVGDRGFDLQAISYDGRIPHD